MAWYGINVTTTLTPAPTYAGGGGQVIYCIAVSSDPISIPNLSVPSSSMNYYTRIGATADTFYLSASTSSAYIVSVAAVRPGYSYDAVDGVVISAGESGLFSLSLSASTETLGRYFTSGRIQTWYSNIVTLQCAPYAGYTGVFQNCDNVTLNNRNLMHVGEGSSSMVIHCGPGGGIMEEVADDDPVPYYTVGKIGMSENGLSIFSSGPIYDACGNFGCTSDCSLYLCKSDSCIDCDDACTETCTLECKDYCLDCSDTNTTFDQVFEINGPHYTGTTNYTFLLQINSGTTVVASVQKILQASVAGSFEMTATDLPSAYNGATVTLTMSVRRGVGAWESVEITLPANGVTTLNNLTIINLDIMY